MLCEVLYMAAKKTVGLRLTEATIRELDSLAKKYKVSQSDVVAVLIHCAYHKGYIDEEDLNNLFEVVSRC